MGGTLAAACGATTRLQARSCGSRPCHAAWRHGDGGVVCWERGNGAVRGARASGREYGTWPPATTVRRPRPRHVGAGSGGRRVGGSWGMWGITRLRRAGVHRRRGAGERSRGGAASAGGASGTHRAGVPEQHSGRTHNAGQAEFNKWVSGLPSVLHLGRSWGV